MGEERGCFLAVAREDKEIALIKKFSQEVACASFHGGAAGMESFFEQMLCFGTKSFVVPREFDERVESPGADDGAAIVEIVPQCSSGALAFARGEFEARDHLRDVPAQFDLCGFGEEAEELRFVAVEETRLLRGDFLRSVGSPHPHEGILVPKTGD